MFQSFVAYWGCLSQVSRPPDWMDHVRADPLMATLQHRGFLRCLILFSPASISRNSAKHPKWLFPPLGSLKLLLLHQAPCYRRLILQRVLLFRRVSTKFLSHKPLGKRDDTLSLFPSFPGPAFQRLFLSFENAFNPLFDVFFRMRT